MKICRNLNDLEQAIREAPDSAVIITASRDLKELGEKIANQAIRYDLVFEHTLGIDLPPGAHS